MKKKILFLLVGLNLLLVSSISMSLAWFLGASAVYIDPFKIEVDADADLLISYGDKTDINDAKNSITHEELGSLNELIPVSSMRSFTSNWISNPDTKKPEFMAEYKKGNQIEPTTGPASKGSFSIQVHLWTISSTPKYVTFDSSYKEGGKNEKDKTYAPLITPDIEKNEKKVGEIAKLKATKNYKAIADQEIEALGIQDESQKNAIYQKTNKALEEEYKVTVKDDLNNVINSVRFSILDYKNLARKDESDTSGNYIIIDPTKVEGADPVVFGGRLCTSLTRDYFDYYTDSNGVLKETLFGDAVDESGNPINRETMEYSEAAEKDIPRDLSKEASCFNAGTHKGVHPLKEEYLKSLRFEEEKSLTPEQADFTTHREDSTYGYLIKLEPRVKHTLVLSVYLEGWDRDNLDSTQEGSFDLNIRFRLCEAPGEFTKENLK